ncbi:MAG: DUF5335 family protein [Cyanobacteria bacterium J06555_13]
MLTQPLNHQCARSLVQPYWADFCEIFSEEHRNRMVTVQVLSSDSEEIDTFDPAPLNFMGYDPFRIGNFLAIIMGNTEEAGTYDHIVTYPKEIDIFYERGEQIFAVVITDKKRAKTVIYFEEEAIVLNEEIPQFSSRYARKGSDILSLVQR